MWHSSSIIFSLVQQLHLVKSDSELYSFSYFYFMQGWMPVQFYDVIVLYSPLGGFIWSMQYYVMLKQHEMQVCLKCSSVEHKL